LVLTWVLGIVAGVGAVNGRRRRISNHCPLMAVGALLNWLPVLIVMIPTWLGVAAGAADVPTPTIVSRIAPLGHGVLGAFAQLLLTYTVARMYWLEDLPPDRPIWLMRIALIVWVVTLIGGTAVYLALYTG
jgi:hypothetical protein